MGLTLISGRDVTRLEPIKMDSGWVNCARYGKTYPYLIIGGGLTQVTVTASGCDGVTIIDWDSVGGAASGGYAAVATNGQATITVLLDLGEKNRLVVRVKNPAEGVKIVMNAEKISPPPCSRIWGRWRCLPWR